MFVLRCVWTAIKKESSPIYFWGNQWSEGEFLIALVLWQNEIFAFVKVFYYYYFIYFLRGADLTLLSEKLNSRRSCLS